MLVQPPVQPLPAMSVVSGNLNPLHGLNGSSGALSVGSGASCGGGKNSNKKPRLVFTDLQRRTLQAIFKETKRPTKEMQITISQQLGLELSTVGNFFMNARRRSQDKWMEDPPRGRAGMPNNAHHQEHEHAHLSPGKKKNLNGNQVLALNSNVIVACP